MIGSNLAHALAAAGAKVTLLNTSAGNAFNIQDIKQKVTLALADVADKKALEQHIRNKDIIFHLAAKVSPFTTDFNEILEDMNVTRTSNILLLEAVRKHNDRALVVFSGSRMEYGRLIRIPAAESTRLEPTSFYGIDKAAAEKYYMLYNKTYGIPTISFRITNPYGPRSQMRSSSFNIVNWFIRKALDNEQLTIYGDGNQLRDYIYVEDLAGAMLIAASHKKAVGDVFNLGSGTATRFKDMAAMIVQQAGSGSIAHLPYPEQYQKAETGDFVADIKKIRKLGWQPTTALQAGIKKTVEFYRQHRQHYW